MTSCNVSIKNFWDRHIKLFFFVFMSNPEANIFAPEFMKAYTFSNKILTYLLFAITRMTK